MGYALVSPPASEPVELAEAKAHLRVTSSDEDDLITELIVAAREICEMTTGRSLITQTWRADFPCFPVSGEALRLPHGPVQSVTSIYYYDDTNADTLLASSVYKADLTEQLAKVRLAPDQYWPSVTRQSDAVRVTYEAGYGDDGIDVPRPILQAMLLLIGEWFRNREASSERVARELPFAVTSLLGRYIVRSQA